MIMQNTFTSPEQEGTALKEACGQLSLHFQVLSNNLSHLQTENERIKSVVKEVLEVPVKDIVLSNGKDNKEHCERCDIIHTQFQQVREAKEKLEFMKPYTHELLTKNEIATERIRMLEKELAREREAGIETRKNRERCTAAVEQLAESVSIAQQQIHSCQKHLVHLTQQAKELEVKNAELDLVNRHQRCILSDYQSCITTLRKQILQSYSAAHD
ncbi:uncharacterized protein [Watersipora subatra]|uniref:uncharacterized protein n=1 Tax=Watersipora subatra TaxID=2589382 RepID=UPI00355AE71D